MPASAVPRRDRRVNRLIVSSLLKISSPGRVHRLKMEKQGGKGGLPSRGRRASALPSGGRPGAGDERHRGAAWMQEVSSPWTVPRSRRSAISFVCSPPAPAWVPWGILTNRPFGNPSATSAASAGGVTGSGSPEKRRTGT